MLEACMSHAVTLTQRDVEPACQQLQEPGQPFQQGQFQLVVVGQVDQYGPQGNLQQPLGHLVAADHPGQALLSCRYQRVIWAGQVLEEQLDDVLTQLRQLHALPHLQGAVTADQIRSDQIISDLVRSGLFSDESRGQQKPIHVLQASGI